MPIDSQTFCQRFMPHSARLHREAMRMLRNADDADDVVQDVYTRLWQKRDTLDATDDAALLLAMTRHQCVDLLRRRAAHSQASIDDLSTQAAIDSSLATDLARQTEDDERLAATMQMVDTLPADQQRVVRMRAIDEMDYAAIAAAMGQTENGVRVLMCRARRRLRMLAESLLTK